MFSALNHFFIRPGRKIYFNHKYLVTKAKGDKVAIVNDKILEHKNGKKQENEDKRKHDKSKNLSNLFY